MYIPSFPTYLSVHILTKGEFISSCSRPAVDSNIVQITCVFFFVNVFLSRGRSQTVTDYRTLFRTMVVQQSATFIRFIRTPTCYDNWRPMSKIHFWSHFLPFQIDITIFILWFFLQNVPPAAIFDVRKSLLIAFLAISDRYGTFLEVRNSLSISFLVISDRSAILDVRNSLLIAFLDISDRSAIFYVWNSFLNWTHTFSEKEIMDCILILKNNKTRGQDMIIN